jgi:hypothetical protein
MPGAASSPARCGAGELGTDGVRVVGIVREGAPAHALNMSNATATKADGTRNPRLST